MFTLNSDKDKEKIRFRWNINEPYKGVQSVSWQPDSRPGSLNIVAKVKFVELHYLQFSVIFIINFFSRISPDSVIFGGPEKSLIWYLLLAPTVSRKINFLANRKLYILGTSSIQACNVLRDLQLSTMVRLTLGTSCKK